ncbi:AAA family ATPase [Fimbriiglobus ruber]|uniref:Kinase n=1 Tax=Fimbriiglobus ruber TaxID=1908690 RepID=A0A225D2N2_9BACT|nr:ATP-binding protein [Fimbriiglobus ruber]OWK35841.1 hypothetical protein FRUB_08404 [Fimbriiglobus ruber]
MGVQEFVILAGLPGSGKSTLSRQLKTERGFFVVSPDGLRLALNAGVYPRGDANGDYVALESVVWKLAETALKDLLAAGHNVALDATNLTASRRAYWRSVAAGVARQTGREIAVTVHWCSGSWDSAERWTRERGHTPEEYAEIRRKLEAAVEPPTADEGAFEWHGPNPRS